MFCSKCSKEIIDKKAEVCSNCGAKLNDVLLDKSLDKSSSGFWIGILLGLVGLIIGLCIYPSNSISRKTFFRGWLYSLLVSSTIILIIFVIAIIQGNFNFIY